MDCKNIHQCDLWKCGGLAYILLWPQIYERILHCWSDSNLIISCHFNITDSYVSVVGVFFDFIKYLYNLISMTSGKCWCVIFFQTIRLSRRYVHSDMCHVALAETVVDNDDDCIKKHSYFHTECQLAQLDYCSACNLALMFHMSVKIQILHMASIPRLTLRTT